MSDEYLDLTEERRKAKTLGSQSPEYKKLCKEVKKACKKAEKEWLEAKAVDAESAFARGHSKKRYIIWLENSVAKNEIIKVSVLKMLMVVYCLRKIRLNTDGITTVQRYSVRIHIHKSMIGFLKVLKRSQKF